MNIQLPYGKNCLPLNINSEKFLIETPKEKQGLEKINDIISHVLDSPLDAQPLLEMISNGNTVAIVVDDYTRPAPTKILLPPVLEKLLENGVKKTDITIIIATGTHTAPTIDQKIQILGKDITNQYNVVSNDVLNGEYVCVGTSSFGNEIKILKEYIDSDIKILIGDIEYHYYAGYGGTRKSVLPGIASRDTIQRNHAMMFQDNACMGLLDENPISIEMIEAMNMAGCTLALSSVLNSHHEIVGVWAGKPETVMQQGVNLVDSMYKKNLCTQPDIVVIAADGHPHDINLYQALKALYTGAQIIKKNGVIILVASCSEGMGNELYKTWMRDYKTSDEIQKALTKHFKLGAHKAYYHRDIIEKYTVILVSELQDSFVKEKLGFIPEENPTTALSKAYELVGKDKTVLVAPQGSTTFFECEK